jgi:hypothetical protein
VVLTEFGHLDRCYRGLVVHLAAWHLCETLGDSDAWVEQYRAAARRTTSLPKKHYLTTKAAGVGAAR